MDQIWFYGPYSLKLQEKTQKTIEMDDFLTLKDLKADLQRMSKTRNLLKEGLFLDKNMKIFIKSIGK